MTNATALIDAAALDTILAPLSLPQRLVAARQAIAGPIVLTTSFGLEDQAITHAIHEAGVTIEIATLDTGRLFPETYDVWAETERRYGRRIAAVVPDHLSIEEFAARYGINGFRDSVEARKACCGLRKVEPLGRALTGAAGWVTGMRAEQSAFRSQVRFAAPDEAHGVVKLNPLADWSRDQVAAYVADHRVPYNVLHDRGFPSIGCAPCTRAVRVGEPERAGRWWWESEDKKECGLHLPAVSVPPSAAIAAALAGAPSA